MKLSSRRIGNWIAGIALLIALLAVSCRPDSIVTFVIPDGYRGLVKVPFESSLMFWQSKDVICTVSNNGEASAIIGPTFSLKEARYASGKEFPIYYGRPNPGDVGLIMTEYDAGDYFYVIVGDLADYEAGWRELKRKEMTKSATN